MTTLFFKWITHAVQLMTVISCIYYLSNKRAVQPYRLFATGWAAVLLYDLTMVVIGLINPVNNHWVYNIAFAIIQLFCIWIFIEILGQRKWIYALLFYAAFAISNLIFLQGKTVLNTYTLAFGGTIILIAASVKLFLLWKEDTSRSLFADPDFWLCAGFIFYWGTATPFFSMYNYLWQVSEYFFTIYFYTVNFGATVILNLCIIKALQCSLRIAKR